MPMGTQRGIGSFTSSASARKLSFRVLFWNSSSPPPWGCKDGVGPDAEEAVGSAAGNSSHKRAKEAVCLRRRAYRTKRPISGRSTFCVTTRKWLSGLMWVFSMSAKGQELSCSLLLLKLILFLEKTFCGRFEQDKASLTVSISSIG